MDASSQEYIDEIKVVGAHDVSLSICRTKPRGVRVAKKVNQRKSKLMGCTCRLKYYNRTSLSTSSIEQEFIPSIPWHAIFVFLDPILIGVMQVEYQNKKESPFDTHPLQKNTFLTAICIYGALLGIKMQTKTRDGFFQEILNYGLLLSGAFSSVSLLSILLKQHHLLWIVLTIWGSIPIVLSRHMLKSSACWITKMLAKLTWGVCKDSSANGSNDICPRV
ncbi:hypothetical protein AAZX31_01G124200 [Glycine max]|uniref:Uncharacterized protein n=2 Tax=Glycine subgen. Soja TaxID=1462606 RepID=A0A0B2QXD1_GLYSO|nr:hypothetical protein GYH30_001473 [Glycine max]KAH1266433.1 hypothetical protein GmHk_01G001930 [Glycine max]KHN26306.1 hypothetical protein glysoja_046568 [Glycine soja]KRH76162.2 hypothetical protein GLYMA_01G135800v4 [Glycine max]RZC29839.1 hypothetical protein D0Y65_001441 [Glycine soja]